MINCLLARVASSKMNTTSERTAVMGVSIASRDYSELDNFSARFNRAIDIVVAIVDRFVITPLIGGGEASDY